MYLLQKLSQLHQPVIDGGGPGTNDERQQQNSAHRSDNMYRFHIFTPMYKQFDARWCVVNLQINNKLT